MGAFFSAAVGPAPAAVLLAMAVICAITDLWKGRIYNAITYPTIALGIVLQIALHGWPGLWSALGGFAVGFFPPFLLFSLGVLGGGDVKLLAAVGTTAGAVAATEATILAFLFGAVIGLGMLAWVGKLFASLGRLLRVLAGFIVPGLSRKAVIAEGETPTMMRFGIAVCLAILATLYDLRSGALTGLVM